MYANKISDLILEKLKNIQDLTIGEALLLKSILGLTNAEATAIFLGGINNENI